MNDLLISAFTLSGYARAQTHFKMAKESSNMGALGHRAVALVEMVPVLGLTVALIDMIVSKIISCLCGVSDNLKSKPKTVNFKDLPSVFQQVEKDMTAGSYKYGNETVELPDANVDLDSSYKIFDAKLDDTPLDPAPNFDTSVTVKNCDTISYVLDLVKKGALPEDIAMLNLANETSTGGGVKRGARAQEEDICRASTLYKYLDHAHQKITTGKGRYVPEHGCLYTPTVIYRDAKYQPLEKPVSVHTITTASYYMAQGAYNRTELEIPPDCDIHDENEIVKYPNYIDGMEKKIKMSLRAAAADNKKVLVLGALGCGAFRNSPSFVAGKFKEALESIEFKGRFKEVHFAVLAREGKPHEATNLATYTSVLST